MPFLPRQPQKLSLGFLEAEVLEIIWSLDGATAKEIHDRILADPDRELTYASVSTVLKRLSQKGWLERTKQSRAFVWRSRLSRHEAQVLQTHDQLQKLLQVGSPEIVAAFANELDSASAEKFEAIAQQLKAARQARSQPEER
ncbi:MAG: MarR family transcriptional regulator [Synechococcales cyanobacterium CRU_2_2]|nr:MarR family transcriptional regulator [Synechococcales cyanobacterium CRU_2_2]